MRALEPPGWPRARGYAHGIEASGRLVFTAGQIGWDTGGSFAPDFAGQVRQAMRESVQVFIAPPDPSVLRERLETRGADSAEAIEARLKVAEVELAAQGDFDHLIVNDDLDRAGAELEEIVRAELGMSLDSAAE